MTIYLLRGAHANEYELQNYSPLLPKYDIKVITTHNPLTQITLPKLPLWSLSDLPQFPYRRQIFNRLTGGEQWLLGLERIVRVGDIVHTAETYTPYTHQAVQLRKQGLIKKLICTCWETISHNNEKFARMRQWKHDAYRYVDLFHVPTHRAERALVVEGVEPSKIVVIPYGVDQSRFRPRNLSGVSRKGRGKRVLTVARLEKEKGMEIIERVAYSLPDYTFTVIGRGSYLPRGKNIVVRSCDYRQLHLEYQHADLFLLPSISTPTWEEQYGMAVVEAISCGLPVVVSDSGALPEVVGNDGLVVPQKASTQAYIDAIINLKTSLGKLNKKWAATVAALQLTKLYN